MGLSQLPISIDKNEPFFYNQNMKSSTSRNRVINAAIYFASHTRNCGKIKLFKLFYLLDFEHYRQTGRSVTGLDYQAWMFGPVPVELMQEWDHFRNDLAESIRIEREQIIDYSRMSVKVNDGVEFDESEFTPRQIKIMQSLCKKYHDNYSGDMIDVTHQQNGAWSKVWNDGNGDRATIPYELSIPDDFEYREDILHLANEALGISKRIEDNDY